MSKPNELLEDFYSSTLKRKTKSFTASKDLRNKIEFICRCNANKAPIRFLMSCLLAKLDKPAVDIRKPYTEIPGDDSFSGRFYDENYIQSFVHKYKLPCNPTTAYLTPAFRNNDRLLTPDLVLVGRPREAYTYTLQILDAVHNGKETSKNVFQEIIRFLIVIKDENEIRMKQLLAELKQTQDVLPLSSEEIVTLLTQHLSSKHASRLPVLIVAAAYMAVGDRIGEGSMPLEAHNAADKQTGSLGDIEITYIFITTDVIELEVIEYAKSLYEKTAIEFAILDCIGFIRHYLHFFHRTRITFLNIYQELVIAEPTSSVSQPLKEVFLALRRAAEADR